MGLVSDEAAVAYEGLCAASGLPEDVGAGAVDVESPAVAELLQAGLICFSGSGVVRAVHPAIALRRLLDRQHRHLSALQANLATAWEQYAAVVSPMTGLVGALGSDGVGVVRDRAEVARLAAGLYRSARKLLRGTFTAGSETGPTIGGALLPPADAVAAGVEFRVLYDVERATSPDGADAIKRAVAAGEQARIRKTLPVNVLLVDDAVALVTIDETGSDGAVHVRSPAMLSLLAGWFDALWLAPDSTSVSGPEPAELTPARHKVLCLMASGLADEAIARRTGTAVRTVRRHIGAILQILQVDSRFAAGAAAVRRGWLC